MVHDDDDDIVSDDTSLMCGKKIFDMEDAKKGMFHFLILCL